MVQGIMTKQNELMPEKEKDMRVHHSTTNIIRAIVLLKRADNTLTSANNSLEGTGMESMIEDIGMSKGTIAYAIGKLEKYKYEVERENGKIV